VYILITCLILSFVNAYQISQRATEATDDSYNCA